MADKNQTSFSLEVEGTIYSVKQFSFPFREGVELEVEVNGEVIRVSDRQLGEQEAVRILTDLIRQKI